MSHASNDDPYHGDQPEDPEVAVAALFVGHPSCMIPEEQRENDAPGIEG
jgi:hypothetical protein